MNISSRPRATVVQQANCNALSENSHSSESAAGSNSSSNTSWATHFPLAVSHAPDTLPQGAKSPQVFTPSLEDVPVGPTPTVKSRARVLRKPHPPISIANASTRRWSLFHSFNRDPPSRSSRVRVNLDDDAPFVPALPYHLSFSPSSAPMPPSSYDVSRRFRSSSDNSLHSRRTNVFAGGVGRPSPVARPQDALERLCAELSRVQEGDSHEETKNDTHHLSTAAHPAVVHRNKPLPAPPGFPRVNSDLAPDPPMEMFPTRPQLSYRHSSFTTPSDEQAEYQFGRFSAEPNAGSHPFVYDYARAHRSYTSRSDTRHPQAWSDSDYVSPVENYAHSEAHYYVFQPQYHYPEPHRMSY
ncbi:hypothetical protein K439DRAFT_1084946 [Ramaria rubella]|nr:hypothetical protein K439DRAFT_1084946 [Ramaria rubella]